MLVGLQAGTTTLELSWVVLQKLDLVLPDILAIPLLDTYPKDAPTYNDLCSTVFIAAIFVIARSLKELRYYSKEEWI